MTTFVNNDVQSGNIIYSADHNEQGARIAAVLNGGIDAANLAENAVGTAELIDDAVTSAKLAPSVTTDANGWTVYDLGTWKEYVKKTANGSAAKTQYEAWDLMTETLPVGVVSTDIKEVQVTPIYVDYSEFLSAINIRHTTTTNIVLRATALATISTTYRYAFYIKLKV